VPGGRGGWRFKVPCGIKANALDLFQNSVICPAVDLADDDPRNGRW